MRNNARGYSAGLAPGPPPFNPYMRPTANLAMPQYYSPMTDMDALSSASWYPDSGASHHLTFNPNNLAYRTPYNGHEQVMMGNGQGVSIQSLGQSKFPSPNNPNVHFTLNELLHVPNVSKNLLSVSKFAQDNNVIFELHPYKCFVKSQDSKHVLLEGTVGSDGLYKFKPFKFFTNSGDAYPSTSSSNFSISNNPVNCNSDVAFTAFDNDFHTWHLRLGHAHTSAIQSVLQLCNVACSNKYSIPSCVFCCMGKSHRLHAPLSTTVYSNPFEVIHCDLWGPAPFLSYNGYSYYITFVDTYTKYTWIYFLKAKSDALQAFTQFLAFIKTQFHTTIKALQSD
jgi:histone deacetylase 1/2